MQRGECLVFVTKDAEARDGVLSEQHYCVNRLGPGSFFGEQAGAAGAETDWLNCNATVVSASPVQVLVLTRHVLTKRLSPHISASFRAYAEGTKDADRAAFGEQVRTD